jgi:hypothetical protein
MSRSRQRLKAALPQNGYLARSDTPKFYIDAEIQNLDQPLIGLDLDVTADVSYKVSSGGVSATYPVKTAAPRHILRFTHCR